MCAMCQLNRLTADDVLQQIHKKEPEDDGQKERGE